MRIWYRIKQFSLLDYRKIIVLYDIFFPMHLMKVFFFRVRGARYMANVTKNIKIKSECIGTRYTQEYIVNKTKITVWEKIWKRADLI